ncbi:MAG: esterase-like activity of phytase family protein [Candidatus Bipolaricaulota bacterium]|nr:MAG: esterase-like activity of phytase family protein [Candidatus Bipolaricaulota bacterium]
MVWKLAIAAGVAVLIGLGVWLLWPTGEDPGPFEFLGAYDIATDAWQYGEIRVGEISGLAYDGETGAFFAVSDNRGEEGTPGKLYTLAIYVTEDGIGNVAVKDLLLLDRAASEPGVQPYEANEIDAEEVVLAPDGSLIVSSERDLADRPWIRRFSQDGEWIGGYQLPTQFTVAEDHGVRSNLGIEALCLADAGATLFAANEQALAQDGPLADVEEGTRVRILRFETGTQTPSAIAQYVYETERIFAVPADGGYADNGVTAMIDASGIAPEFDLIVMERAYVAGVGNDVKLFGVRLENATDVSGLDSLAASAFVQPVEKTLLLRISALAEHSDVEVAPDNLEAMTVGPRLPDGRRTLLLASDNNFNASQRNLFLAFAARRGR